MAVELASLAGIGGVLPEDQGREDDLKRNKMEDNLKKNEFHSLTLTK